MKPILALIALATTVACAPMKNQSSEQFYTWVDASGQIRTTQKPQPNKKKTSPQQFEQTQNNRSPVNGSEAESFDTSGYRASEEIDKHLSDTKMFSWQENGRIINQETQLAVKDPKETSHLTLALPELKIESDDYSDLMDQLLFKWEDVNGVEVDLFRAYVYNEELNTDSISIELARDTDVQSIIFKSYVKHSKMALPNILFLSERFDSLSFPVAPFSHFINESWSSYAHMQGVLVIPKNARYMVILPNPESGVLELGGKKIQLSDRGNIMFKQYLVPDFQ